MNRERDAMGKAAVSGLVLSEDSREGPKHDPVGGRTEPKTETAVVADVSHRLDRLVGWSTKLPVMEGEDTLLHAFVEGLTTILTGHSVALFVGEGEARRSFTARRSFHTDQPSVPPPSLEVEKAKVFVDHLFERTVRLPDSEVVLLLASDDASLAAEGAPVLELVHHALSLLAGARDRARLHDEVERLGSMLVQSDKLASLGQLAAGMVHEINNPLTSILAYSDFLMKRAQGRDDAEDVERARRIAESAQRMLRLSRDIVSYARPSPMAMQPVVLSAVIDQALAFCQHLFEAGGVTVERAFGDGVLPVRGRPEQLEQVFVNLFTNACHALPERGGRVVVTTDMTPDESTVRVTVGDNGHGIHRDHIDQVFQPFFTTKDHQHGTGLGLAIVKRIVDSHDGRVQVDSDESGTRIAIVLPTG